MIPKKVLWKAVREKCLDCSYDQPSEVRDCTVYDCPLWPYRFGSRTTKADPALLSPPQDA